MSHQLQPFNDVQLLCEEIYEENDKKKQPDVRVLVHLISYAEFQFGDRPLGIKSIVRDMVNVLITGKLK